MRYPLTCIKLMACLSATLLLNTSFVAEAQDETPAKPAPAATSEHGSIESDGTVVVPSFRLPPSIYLSDTAKAALPRKPTDQEEMALRALEAGKASELRARVSELAAPFVKRVTDRYSVNLQPTTIAGVQAIRVTPTTAIPTRNRRKIMLNLPGGGFVMGAAGGPGLFESIPLSTLAQVEIVTITYRQAPEATFPAASEDVAAVYRELLKTHAPKDIAIFGCSAGGLLTAESIAWFVKEKLPLPKAIGIFCASADARSADGISGGDSMIFARHFQALPPSSSLMRSYFRDVDLTDPLVSPVVAPDILRHFPPTLLITGTRAKEMSAAVNTHRELVKAGVDADLHVWDGLGHAFYMDVGLPESREAFDVMTRFFRRHLDLQ